MEKIKVIGFDGTIRENKESRTITVSIELLKAIKKHYKKEFKKDFEIENITGLKINNNKKVFSFKTGWNYDFISYDLLNDGSGYTRQIMEKYL